MTWFSCRKTDTGPEKYPYVRRIISPFTPKDTIKKDTWLFADVSGLNIAHSFDANINEYEDHSSYIVVYENRNTSSVEKKVPVPTVLNNGIIYFKAAETHNVGVLTDHQYVIYYKTPGLRYLKKTTYLGQEYYQLTTEAYGEYNPSFSSVDLSSYEVFVGTSNHYNFSFINPESSWSGGASQKYGSKCYLNFSGPIFELYGSKGPSYGKFKIKIISFGDEATPDSLIELNNKIIDCYSPNYTQNTLLFSINNLSSRECSLELETIVEKNILSSGNDVTLNSYQFSFNLYPEIGDEELLDTIPYVKVL